MNGLSDSLTIGIVITLVFGALFFYLYSRLTQNEKRVSLIENILLDLKMSADSGWGTHGVSEEQEGHEVREYPAPVDHVEPVSAPEPLNGGDVDTNEEDMYKDMLAQVPTTNTNEETKEDEIKSFDITTGKPSSPKGSVQVTKVQANYESMSNKELKAMVKQRGLSAPSQAGKKELIGILRKADGNGTPSTVEPGSFLGSQQGASLEGEPLEEVESL